MSASKRPTIAILGDFPVGHITGKHPNHMLNASWLLVLYGLLKSVDCYDFHWITIHKSFKTEEVYTKGNHTFHLLSGSKRLIGLCTGYLFDRLCIKRYLQKIQPDLVHAWGTELCYGLAAADYPGKTILSIQGLLNACCKRAKLCLFERLQSLYEPYSIRKANKITTESPWAADRVKELAPNADITLFEYAPESRFFDIERKLSDKPSCLLAGRATPLKNIPTAIAAFSRPALSHITLYIAGANKQRFEHLNPTPNIVFLGRVSREKMVELLQESWCLVHPSLADSCPNIVKEARLIGLPVVLTIDNGAKQYVIDQKSGYIIQPRDVDAIVKAVLHITKSPQVTIEMGNFDKERCTALLSHETMFQGITNLYKQMLNN